jgi:hypothetical protein
MTNNAKVIYDMPEDEYRAVPALSYSAIKEINVSVNDYLYSQEEEQTDTIGKTIGKAYHKAILEGFQAFHDTYKAPFIGTDDCLKSKDDLINFCTNNGVEFKQSWTKDKIFNAIQSCGHDVKSYDMEREEHEKGFIIIPSEAHKKISAYAEIIEESDIAKKLYDAKKEVSVFWREDGINCKARFDALIPEGVFDLKTFDNSKSLNIDKAVNLTIANYQYDVQARWYTKAYKAMYDAKIEGFENENPLFFMLFLKTNKGLDIRTRVLRDLNDSETIMNAYWENANQKIENAKSLFKKHIIKKEEVKYDFYFDELRDCDLPSYYFKD